MQKKLLLIGLLEGVVANVLFYVASFFLQYLKVQQMSHSCELKSCLGINNCPLGTYISLSGPSFLEGVLRAWWLSVPLILILIIAGYFMFVGKQRPLALKEYMIHGFISLSVLLLIYGYMLSLPWGEYMKSFHTYYRQIGELCWPLPPR